MCRMESTSGTRGGPQYGMRGWAAAIPTMQPQRSHNGQRRYKFEARLGKGRHQGTLYRARDDHGDVWAVEVVPQQQQKQQLQLLLQKQGGGQNKKGKKLASKLGLGAGEEEAYTDFKTGARCYVSRLPRESMRQRLSRAGGYGLGTVLRWAKQLATAVVKSNDDAAAEAGGAQVGAGFGGAAAARSAAGSSGAAGVLGLDSLWLDDTDCLLVGDYRPSSYAMPPSSSYGYQTESEEELDEELDEAEERVVAEAKQAPALTAAQQEQQQQAEAEEAQQEPSRVLDEEEVKAFGVLLYQLATKTALPGDTAQAYAQILARAEARDEASGKQALLDLLRQTLQQQREAEEAAREGEQQQGEEERRPRSEELAPLAELIADALMGKPQLANNLLAAVPTPRSPGLAPVAAEEDKAEAEPAALPHEDEKQQPPQQQEQEHMAAAKVEAPSPAVSPRSLTSSVSSSSSFSSDLADCPAPLRPILGALRQAGDAKLRQRALYGLKKLGSKAAEPAVLLALIEVMLDTEGAQDPVSRRMAAWTLGSLGDAAALMGAVPALIKALGDSEAGVRAAAAWALGGMGRAAEKQGALATLLHRSVKDEDAQVRDLAGKSLARLKRVTGMKRRRPTETEADGEEAISSSEDRAGGTRVEAYYAKRRPISLASTTRSMAQASINDLPPLIPIPPPQQLQMQLQLQQQQQQQPQHPLTPILVGVPNGAAGFQLVHAPGTGQPVALAVAPGLSPSSASLASSTASSAASTPTALSAPAAGSMYYYIHVPPVESVAEQQG